MLIDKFDKVDLEVKGRRKKMIEEQIQRKKRALERIVACFGDRLSDGDHRTLAGVLMVEENALLHCEAGKVDRAISLLRDQEEVMADIAVTILKRVA